jgi:hypothetical protein
VSKRATTIVQVNPPSQRDKTSKARLNLNILLEHFSLSPFLSHMHTHPSLLKQEVRPASSKSSQAVGGVQHSQQQEVQNRVTDFADGAQSHRLQQKSVEYQRILWHEDVQ